MKKSEYVPSIFKDAFYCPRCSVLVPHIWFDISLSNSEKHDISVKKLDESGLALHKYNYITTNKRKRDWFLNISVCSRCNTYTLWENGNIIFPYEIDLPQPHEDMFEDVRQIYIEAMHVYKHSPRATAALLRLAIETMIPQLEDYKIKTDTINNMIAELVKNDIPEHIQQGLDSIRIYGNEGIHAGEIVLNEEPEVVLFLFELLNIMVEELITKRRRIKAFYDKLPASKLSGVINRDRVKN